MSLRIVGLSHRGVVRPANEDTVSLAGWLSAAADGVVLDLEISDGRALAVVADGLGGHAASERASRLALTALGERAARLYTPAGVVSCVDEVDVLLYEEMNRDLAWRGMGTTLAGFVFDGSSVLCFNVGDSRCYAVYHESLVQLSTDDSPTVLPGQTTNVVTQTIGGAGGHVPIDPHVVQLDDEPGTRYLACSDGLTDYVPLELIEAAVTLDAPLTGVARRLLQLALDAGAPDNVSVVLAENHDSAPPTDPETPGGSPWTRT